MVVVGVKESAAPSTYVNMELIPHDRINIHCDTLIVAERLKELAADKCAESPSHNTWLFSRELYQFLRRVRSKLEGVLNTDDRYHGPISSQLYYEWVHQDHRPLKLKLVRPDDTSNWQVIDLPKPEEQLAINIHPSENFYRIGRYYW